MDRIELTTAQNGIITALLERQERLRQQVAEQIAEAVNLMRAAAGAGDDWQLTGNPGAGFAFVAPEPPPEPEDDEDAE